ncbi:UNVERIFIED_CONTAM: putative adhesin [Acetivibrio alkalicellulosi]
MAISVILGAIGLFAEGFPPFTSQNTISINQEKSFDVKDISTINIKTVSTNINIIPDDSQEIRVHYHGKSSPNSDAPTLEVTRKGSIFHVEIKYPKQNVNLFNLGFFNLKLDIYIPNDYSENISITTVSADTKLNNMSINKFEKKSVSGCLSLKNFDANTLSFSTTSGDANIIDFSGNIDFNSVSGDIKCNFATYNYNININTTSGDAKLVLPEDSQFKFDFITVSGDLKSNFPMTFENNSKRNKKGNVGMGENKIYFKSVSGDLQIKN